MENFVLANTEISSTELEHMQLAREEEIQPKTQSNVQEIHSIAKEHS